MAKYAISFHGAAVLTSPARYQIKAARLLKPGQTLADIPRTSSQYGRVTFDLSEADVARLGPGALVLPQPLPDPTAQHIYADPTATLASFIERVVPSAFASWRDGLNGFRGQFSEAAIGSGFDHLYYGLYGLALICRDNSRTKEWRQAYVGLVIQGAADTTNASQFLHHTHAGTTRPTTPISWVSTGSGSNPVRLNLANVVAVSGSLPANVLPSDYASWTGAVRD